MPVCVCFTRRLPLQDVPLLTVAAPLQHLLLAVLAAAARRRPPGRRALAGVQLPGAVTRHRAVLLTWQPSTESPWQQEGGRGKGERGGERRGQLVSLSG